MANKKEHKIKMIAPITITVLIILYLVAFSAVTIIMGVPLIFVIAGLIVSIISIAVCVYILWERIREIKSGEEDDLYKY